MKKIRQWILPPVALLLTAAGALLPCVVSRIQDVYVEKMTESRAFDPVSLTLQSGGDMLAGLRNLSGRFDSMYWSGETKLSPDAAAAAAQDVFLMMSEGGYIWNPLEDVTDYDVAANLVLSTDEAGSSSAVVWFCSLPGGTVVIDDESGKMVALEAWQSPEEDAVPPPDMKMNATAGSTSMNVDSLIKLADKWTTELSNYYDIEIYLGEPLVQERFCVSFPLWFLPQNERDTCKVSLLFYDDGYIRFNL